MTDLIRRSVLIDEICRSSIYKWSVEEDQAAHNWALNIINSQPSVKSSNGELISRADAIEAAHKKCDEHGLLGRYDIQWVIESLPSADADGEDLIIKGAKGIQDGLYNIKNGKLFKYKANGGTVRTYPIVPSADAVQGWIPCSEKLPSEDERGWYLVTVKGHELFVDVAPFNDELWKGLASHQKVIAWQPLPKPYKGGDDE